MASAHLPFCQLPCQFQPHPLSRASAVPTASHPPSHPPDVWPHIAIAGVPPPPRPCARCAEHAHRAAAAQNITRPVAGGLTVGCAAGEHKRNFIVGLMRSWRGRVSSWHPPLPGAILTAAGASRDCGPLRPHAARPVLQCAALPAAGRLPEAACGEAGWRLPAVVLPACLPHTWADGVALAMI